MHALHAGHTVERMRDRSDEELIRDFQVCPSLSERNGMADVLIQRHYRRVGLWCMRWCGGDVDRASDLTQEIFARVYRNLDSFAGTAKFSTWLYTVTRNHCINAAQAERLRETEELGDVLLATLEAGGLPADERLARQSQLEMARALLTETLDATERTVVLLHYCEELSLPTITRQLGLTNQSGAKAYIVSAHRKLKSALIRWAARQR